MGIKFTGGKGSTTTKLGQLKTELAAALEEQGMPSTIYVLVTGVEPSQKWLNESGLSCVEGKAIISAKTGQIMYNFSGSKVRLGEVEGRMGGNFFLPAKGYTVDAETLEAYREAKAERDASFAKATEEADLEAGETVS